MKIIGLCGGSGSGKGKACELFADLGIPSIDTDAVYHELTDSPSACLDALSDEFGKEIITEEGRLNRRRLAEIVFSGEGSVQKLERLNKLSHKFILDETDRRLAEYERMDVKAAIVDAPLLFESGYDKRCDILICVVADREKRIERIMMRDSITRADAEKRIASQMPDEDLISRCDYVIRNDGDILALWENVKNVADKILT